MKKTTQKNKYLNRLPEPGEPVTVTYVVSLPGGAKRTNNLPMSVLHISGGDDPRMILRFPPGVTLRESE